MWYAMGGTVICDIRIKDEQNNDLYSHYYVSSGPQIAVFDAH